MKSYDVVAMGEILIDFTRHSVSESGMTLFEQNPGGAPANLLAAVQKLGGSTAFIGKVGEDMHGRFLENVLRDANIDTSGMVFDKDYFTTLAFVDLAPNGERSFSFARKPGADTQIKMEEIDFSLIDDTKIFHIGSLSLTNEPSKSATLAALEYAKENKILISYDPNYRAPLWESEVAAVDGMRSVIKYADIIKISDEETELITGEKSPEDAAAELLSQGVGCVIVTLGADGAYVATKQVSVKVSAAGCDSVADTTGAGDSFFGGFLYCMTGDNKKPDELTEEDLKAYAEFGNRVAAICVSRRGAIKIMPTLEEVTAKF